MICNVHSPLYRGYVDGGHFDKYREASGENICSESVRIYVILYIYIYVGGFIYAPAAIWALEAPAAISSAPHAPQTSADRARRGELSARRLWNITSELRPEARTLSAAAGKRQAVAWTNVPLQVFAKLKLPSSAEGGHECVMA